MMREPGDHTRETQNFSGRWFLGAPVASLATFPRLNIKKINNQPWIIFSKNFILFLADDHVKMQPGHDLAKCRKKDIERSRPLSTEDFFKKVYGHWDYQQQLLGLNGFFMALYTKKSSPFFSAKINFWQ